MYLGMCGHGVSGLEQKSPATVLPLLVLENSQVLRIFKECGRIHVVSATEIEVSHLLVKCSIIWIPN